VTDIVLITGASSEIGRALLTRMADSNAVIYAHYGANADTLLAHLATLSGPACIIPVQADLSSIEQVDALIDTLRKRHGRPNKIVHLAARPLVLERFAKLDWDAVQADIDISVRSISLILKAFLPELTREKCPGRVVIMLSSVTFGEPPKGFAAYTLVKFALLGLARSLATEFADKQISVNSISPYTMETKFLARLPHKYVELSAVQNPSGRNAEVNDVVPAIEFLLSESTGFITGVNLPITAGAAF
jgi:NAD(P)-dependent dehydrogenase (short-subunit alcohol dehydrogenase family)